MKMKAIRSARQAVMVVVNWDRVLLKPMNLNNCKVVRADGWQGWWKGWMVGW